jgi:crossover junction endodeoxyribonuclease RuvC
MFAGGLHQGIRNELFKRKFPYYEVAPNAVKNLLKFWDGLKKKAVKYL